MSRSAFSVFVFGVYCVTLGAVLILFPERLCSLLGIAPPVGVWLRVAGLLVAYLGCYYIVAARTEWTEFFRASVYVRGSVIVVLGSFVALDLAEPILVLFGVVDLAAAVWTALTLRSSVSRTKATA